MSRSKRLCQDVNKLCTSAEIDPKLKFTTVQPCEQSKEVGPCTYVTKQNKIGHRPLQGGAPNNFMHLKENKKTVPFGSATVRNSLFQTAGEPNQSEDMGKCL